MFCVIVRLIPFPKRNNNRMYSPTNFTNAYKMVKEHENFSEKGINATLRDRVLHKVDPETSFFESVRCYCVTVY